MTVDRFNGLSLQDHHMTISMLEEIEPIFSFHSFELILSLPSLEAVYQPRLRNLSREQYLGRDRGRYSGSESQMDIRTSWGCQPGRVTRSRSPCPEMFFQRSHTAMANSVSRQSQDARNEKQYILRERRGSILTGGVRCE